MWLFMRYRSQGMRFPSPLIPGTLVRRYKRFLADVDLDDGRRVVAHCANTGAMTGLNDPGLRVWLEPNDDPKKKLDFGWRLVEMPDNQWVGIDTAVPNRVIKEALQRGEISELAAYERVRPEVNYGQASRVDFLLQTTGLPDAYVEVKNVHLSREHGWAEFPDAPTTRGTRHLQELSHVAQNGCRAVMLYLVQRTDCQQFRLATDVDPAYAAAFEHALKAGVQMLCYDTIITTEEISLGQALTVQR